MTSSLIEVATAQAAPAHSAKHARRALAAALVGIGRASDPLAAFQAEEDTITNALALLPSSARLPPRGPRACASVPESGADMPAAASRAFVRVAARSLGFTSIEISEAEGDDFLGFTFSYCHARSAGSMTAFALEYQSGWTFSPGPLGREDLDCVLRAARRHFDLFLATMLKQRGRSEATIKRVRASLRPTRTLWPHERDPRGLAEEYPLVFLVEAANTLGRPIYCAHNPMEDTAIPYDHV